MTVDVANRNLRSEIERLEGEIEKAYLEGFLNGVYSQRADNMDNYTVGQWYDLSLTKRKVICEQN